MADAELVRIIETDTMTGNDRLLFNMGQDGTRGRVGPALGAHTRKQAEDEIKWREEKITARYSYEIVPLDDPRVPELAPIS